MENKEPEFREISLTDTYVKPLGINHGYHIPEQEVWMEKNQENEKLYSDLKKSRLNIKG